MIGRHGQGAFAVGAIRESFSAASLWTGLLCWGAFSAICRLGTRDHHDDFKDYIAQWKRMRRKESAHGRDGQ